MFLGEKALNKNLKNALIWLVIFGALLLMVNPFDGKMLGESTRNLPYSSFIDAARNGEIKDVLIKNNTAKIAGHTSDGKIFTTVTPYDNQMVKTLLDSGVLVNVDSGDSGWGFILSQLLPWLPMLLIIVLMAYSSRQMNGGKGGIGGGPLGIGKSKARRFQEKHVKVTFNDVAGIDEAKNELEEIVDFLKQPQKFQKLGGKIPKGVLLVGAPGNGKTLLARAIAGEADVPFFSISGSDFVEVFVGVGASRVRDMFEHAKKHSPCIIFIDEIDAVGRKRDSVIRGGNDEREQTLNQLLVEMDGFEENQGVIVLAATNRSDVLDPALLRAGRFSRRISVPYPDRNGREKILKTHTKEVPLSPDVDLKKIAKGTSGFSGADLANLINEAALMAARSNKLSVSMQDLERAKDKVLMGAERKSMTLTNEEKRLTAFHESGHALVALLIPYGDPIHKVTIIPRGNALGMLVRLPEKDKVSIAKTELLADIKVSMGGRAAEELEFGEDRVTTGAAQDIKNATKIAKDMILNFGMTRELGFRNFSNEYYYQDDFEKISEKTAEVIDNEIKKLLNNCYNEVIDILKKNRSKLDKIVEALLEYETLTGEEVKQIFTGCKIERHNIEQQDEFILGGLPNV
jgi:cell division protease FtsH